VAALPTISVIIPTRDRPGFLLQAVESVLAQQLPPAEVIVVDDAAGGGAREALSTLAASPSLPMRVLPGPGRGPAAARNVGLLAAHGDFIAFLDDDDLWLPEKLSLQVPWLSQHPGLGLLGTSHVRTHSAAVLLPSPPGQVRRLRPVSLASLLRANRFAMSSVVARRACFESSGGFDESLPLAQDWDMWLRIAAHWQTAVLPAVLTIHRLHSAQRSAHSAAMRAGEAEVLRRALERCRGVDWWHRGIGRRRLAWAHCRLGRLLLREGRPAEAVSELKRSLSLSPFHLLTWCALLRSLAARTPPVGAEPL
jgi:glycosyltransferase involved in cell wall biosynthesis